jgi:hypothetical protein
MELALCWKGSVSSQRDKHRWISTVNSLSCLLHSTLPPAPQPVDQCGCHQQPNRWGEEWIPKPLKLLHGRFEALPVSDDGYRKPNGSP